MRQHGKTERTLIDHTLVRTVLPRNSVLCDTGHRSRIEMRNGVANVGRATSENILVGVSETSLFAISQTLSTKEFVAMATEINWVETSLRFNLIPRSFIQSR